eukprot:1413602-Pleurochrysis_carterae.AAC.2
MAEGGEGDALVVTSCGACNSQMLDSEGNPRPLRLISHACDYHKCMVPLHAACMCEAVWMPKNG